MAYTTDYVALPGLVANSTGLATSQFLVVKLASTAGQCILNGTAAGAGNVMGILQNAPAGGEACEVAVMGVAKLKVATSTIAVGDWVGSNSTSLGTDAGTTDNGSVLARALEASSAANDIISVLLIPGGARY